MATLNEISERVGVLQNTVSSLLDNPLVSAMKKTRRRVLCTCGVDRISQHVPSFD